MAKVVVHCGLCGYEPNIELNLPEGATLEALRAAVVTRLGGESLRCSRCHSELVAESGVFTVDEPPRLALARKAEHMRRKIRGVRFAVGSPDGPHGTMWRIWVNRSDVYIAARVAASEMKVSLHASGKWRAAFTEAHFKRETPLIGRDRDRAVDKWDRPDEFAPGWTRAFTIIVPASELVSSDVPISNPGEVVWIDPVPEGWATHVNVLIAAPGATGSEGRGFATAEGRENHTEVVTAIELENGERVWVLAHAERTDEAWVQAVREKVLSEGAAAIAKANDDPKPHDIRAFASGYGSDGTRFYLDLSVRA